VSASLKKPHRPTLVMTGELDVGYPHVAQRMGQDLQHREVVGLPGLRHLASEEDPAGAN
ncbi:uncharacterized protein METZ01_LOCUS185992, partial [marine metagenome]